MARPSTSALVTTPTATGSLTRSARPGKSSEARSAKRSSMTRRRRTTTPRQSTLVSGDPDAIVIVDFPETYNKVGPALVRAGFDPSTTFVTDGLISGDLAEGAGSDAVNGLRGTAPGAPDEGEASTAFDEAIRRAEPTDVDRQTFDAQNFDAVILCYLAAVAAGSTEGADMAEVVQTISGPGGDRVHLGGTPGGDRGSPERRGHRLHRRIRCASTWTRPVMQPRVSTTSTSSRTTLRRRSTRSKWRSPSRASPRSCRSGRGLGPGRFVVEGTKLGRGDHP